MLLTVSGPFVMETKSHFKFAHLHDICQLMCLQSYIVHRSVEGLKRHEEAIWHEEMIGRVHVQVQQFRGSVFWSYP
jgi:hypothetical protein